MDIKNIILEKVKKKMIRTLIVSGILAAVLAGCVLYWGGMPDGELIQTDSTGSAETEMTSTESETEMERHQTGDREEEASDREEKETSSPVQYIYLDVSGAVNAPSVVCIPEGSRVYEAIDAAGGRTEDSDVRTINLASVCEDGQKIYVPTKQEVMEAQETGAALPGQTEDGGTAGSSGSSSQGGSAGNGKVNINTAGSEELQTLTGVGPAIASKIIDYRNTMGSFHSIDEIQNVSGIGEKTYEKFKDQICV